MIRSPASAKRAIRSGPCAPRREPVAPALGDVGGFRVGAAVVSRRFLLVDPGPEVRRIQVRKRQEQIAEISLGIDRDHRDRVDQRFLDDRDPESRLAAAGHADADGVGGEVLGVVEDRGVEDLAGLEIELATEIEEADLLGDLRRSARSSALGRCAHPQPGISRHGSRDKPKARRRTDLDRPHEIDDRATSALVAP